MPYITQDRRELLKPHLDKIVEEILLMQGNFYDGELNFAISYLVNQVMKPETGWRYHWIARAYAVFLAAAAEFYRKVAAPYEDQAIEKNGDL